MTARDAAKRARTQRCGQPEARARLRRAEQFAVAARLIAEEDDPDWRSASAAVAVLAGIAAADAACCSALGKRSRSQDHRTAEALLVSIDPGGKEAGVELRRILDLKDEAHYGFYSVDARRLRSLHARVDRLIAFAAGVLLDRAR